MTNPPVKRAESVTISGGDSGGDSSADDALLIAPPWLGYAQFFPRVCAISVSHLIYMIATAIDTIIGHYSYKSMLLRGFVFASISAAIVYFGHLWIFAVLGVLLASGDASTGDEIVYNIFSWAPIVCLINGYILLAATFFAAKIGMHLYTYVPALIRGAWAHTWEVPLGWLLLAALPFLAIYSWHWGLGVLCAIGLCVRKNAVIDFDPYLGNVLKMASVIIPFFVFGVNVGLAYLAAMFLISTMINIPVNNYSREDEKEIRDGIKLAGVTVLCIFSWKIGLAVYAVALLEDIFQKQSKLNPASRRCSELQQDSAEDSTAIGHGKSSGFQDESFSEEEEEVIGHDRRSGSNSDDDLSQLI
jgi:hypothetical protein